MRWPWQKPTAQRPLAPRARQLRCFVVADVHSDSFHMPQLNPADFDVVFTLGDIDPDTLDYIHLCSRDIPCLGVIGNHEPEDMPGLNNLHCRVAQIQGIRISGFSGIPWRKAEAGKPHRYTEQEARRRLKKLPAVDIMLSHAPPRETSLQEGFTHAGFKAFDAYIEQKKPRYWLHGHLARNYNRQVKETIVIGVGLKMPLTLNFD